MVNNIVTWEKFLIIINIPIITVKYSFESDFTSSLITIIFILFIIILFFTYFFSFMKKNK